MKTALQKKISDVETLIKEAKWKTAQSHLVLIKKSEKNLPQESALTLAQLFRRAHLPETALQTLRPYVRPTSRDPLKATDAEKVEYAANLIALGACREAKKLLSEIDLETSAEGLFFKARMHMMQWDFALASPLYEKYVSLPEISTYQRNIALLNRVLCLVFEERYDEGAKHIHELLTQEGKSLTPLLVGNAYRILGNLDFHRGEYAQALINLQKAHSIFSESNSLDRFNIRKWISLCTYFLGGASELAKINLEGIRQEALIRRNWESARDIDYQVAAFHQDPEGLLKVYFGTPHLAFRQRLLKRFPNLEIPKEYLWKMKSGTEEKAVRVDINALELKPGQSLHRLLQGLQSDFYRAFHVLDLFEMTFPDEMYSSAVPSRVYNVVMTLRKYFKKTNFPLVVEMIDGTYRLSSPGCVELVCQDKSQAILNADDHRLQKLKEVFPEGAFTTSQAVTVLDLARRATQLLLKDALKKGQLKKRGAGVATEYFF